MKSKILFSVLVLGIFFQFSDKSLEANPVFFGLNASTGPVCQEKYRSITIDHTQVGGSDSVNFPVLITGTYSYLATVANGGQVRHSTGTDVEFFADSTLQTKLNWEVQSYNGTNGTVSYWVQVPTLSHTTNTVIYMAYGNRCITTNQSNAAGTWDSYFKGVWHNSDNAANTVVVDSTGTSNGVNHVNTNTKSVAGKWATALAYTGSDYTTLAPSTNTAYQLPNNYTIETWAYETAGNSFGGELWSDLGGGGSSGAEIGMGGADILEYGAEDGTSLSFPLTLHTWYYLVATVSSGNLRNFYVNGSSVGTDPAGVVTPVSALREGGDGTYNSLGYMQEFRFSSTQRSNDWITASFNNQNSPSSFYTIGSEQ